mgnify:CR=1 FL=1
MAGIGKNRVFDRAALEELLQQTEQLLNSAREVSDSLQEEMQQLQELAGEVPAEAAHPAMGARAGELSGKIGDTVAEIEKTQTAIRENLEKLIQQVPMNDALSAAALKTITSTTAGMVSMAEELKAMVRQGSLHLGMDEFRGQVEDFGNRWKGAAAAAGLKMLAAATFMKGLVEYSRFSRDPVNLSTGNLYYEKEDIRLKAVMPLVFRRYYNAMDKGSSALGPGWSHSHAEAVHENKDGSLTLHMEDGKDITLEKDTAENSAEDTAGNGKAGETYRDTRSGRETVTKTKDGYRYEDRKTRHTLTFDREGRLQKREDKNGNHISYRYDENGRLTCAAVYPAQAPEDSTPAGAEDGTAASPQPSAYLDFTYDKDGLLRTLTDHTGRTVTYFPMDGVLNEVTDPVGHTTTYRYTEDGRLRMVKNPRGIMSLRNEYDGNGRITRQRFPDKSGMAYAYDDTKNTTTLTERNGAVITYEQDDRLRNIRTAYQDGSEERDTYDEKDNRTSHTDRNGHTTWYRYDAGSRLTGIVNPLGQETVLTYDENGQITSVGVEGKELLRSTYDRKGNLTGRSDALGRTTSYTHDHRGLPTAIKAPDGSQTSLTYDEKGNITAITDPYGAVTAYEYDDLGRITATTGPAGDRTTYTRDPMDRIRTVTDPAGNTREYTYNESGKVTKIRDFDGNEETITYNSMNRPECLTDKEGRQTLRRYDSMWNVAEEILPTGAVTRYTYDKDNRLQRVELCENGTAQPTAVQENTYDPAGNLLCTKAGGYIGQTTAPEKTAIQQQTGTDKGQQGQQGQQDTPADMSVMTSMAYTYDALDRPVSATDADGNTTRYAYDPLGNLTTVTDPNGNTMTFRYNAAGELTEKTDIHGCTTRYTYNALGQIETITDPNGNTTTHGYAPGGRHIKTTYPGGSSLTYTHDANGRVKTRQHSSGYTLTYTYDSMGRITGVESSKGQKKTYAYDAMGNVTAATDAGGNTTRYTYTMSGKLATVTDPMGNTTEYAYDPLDNLTAIRRKGNSGGKDHATVYERDPFGRVLCITDPLGMEEHFRYDPLGRPIWKKDRDGNETHTTYTMTGQTAGILYADKTTVEMQYDALNRLTKVKDSLGETRIERDRTGRITSITDHNGQTVSYEWGAQGERKSTTYPGGQETTYTYDNMQRLTAMHIRGTQHDRNSTEDPRTITCRYDAEGRLTEKTFPGGIRTTWQYDREDGLPVSLTHTDQNGILDHYTYAYDPMGNKTAVTRQRRGLPRESGAYTYTYDPLGRLAAVAKDGTPLRDYAYDPFSNRAHMTDHHKGSATAYTYDAADRLTASEETTGEGRTRRTYEYDHRGNLTRELQEGIPVHTYAYSAMGRLERTWSYTLDGAIQAGATYHYNGLGQRVGKSMYTAMPDRTAGERTIQNLPQTQPLRQGWTMGQPADSMGAAVHEDYLPDLTRPYHNLLSVTRNDGAPAKTLYWDSNAAAMEENGTFHYYLQDEMGSPIRVSGYDSTDSMADGNHGAIDTYLTYGYDEFGNDLARTTGKELEEAGIPSPYTMQGEGQPFGYTGYRYDTLGATYFAQAREYDPQTGRFHAQDVIAGNGAVPVTLNRYGYCWGNPVSFTDYDGMKGYYFYDPLTYTGVDHNGNTYTADIDKIVNADIKNLEEVYDTTIEPIVMNSQSEDYTSFSDEWNKIADKGEHVDVVVIMTHANNDHFVTDSEMDGDRRVTAQRMTRTDIADLKDMSIDTLLLLGCSMGIKDQKRNVSKDVHSRDGILYTNNSLASQFYQQDHRKTIGQVIAANGSIMHGTDSEGKRIIYAIPNGLAGTENAAFRRCYIDEDGQFKVDEEIDIRLYMGDISDKGYEGICEQDGKKYDKKK